jgi:hypothetical protein
MVYDHGRNWKCFLLLCNSTLLPNGSNSLYHCFQYFHYSCLHSISSLQVLKCPTEQIGPTVLLNLSVSPVLHRSLCDSTNNLFNSYTTLAVLPLFEKDCGIQRPVQKAMPKVQSLGNKSY